ncbi:prepilin peptidase-dependent protein [Shimwellia pseudoproteus]|uniref:prepilin peptidase-dependent protein n=1 Tax=Shimwellia pseudoproteus TaxID=570012 RepID=UPI0018EE3580|nr:prepilin peptidase-dependent protein [Shimwellia pseudoproteus]MBJ3813830.1 prepilin peptidase-dependent protein [Shimwellia pseudoproteus]
MNRGQGFTLPELLLALSLGSLIMLGAMRFLPALQHGALATTQRHQTQTLLWQLALSIGKSVRRAGYCNGQCAGVGLRLFPAGDCLVAQWDFNSNGRWDTSPPDQAEQIAYRLSGTDLEIRRGATDCRGTGWQKMHDPAALRIVSFRVWRVAEGPLVAMALTGVPVTPPGGAAQTVQYAVLQRNHPASAGLMAPLLNKERE